MRKDGKVKNAILVKNIVLKWARESIGFSLENAAEKSKIDIEKVKSWESRDSEIKVSELKKLAKAYKRTLSFFFLNDPPEASSIPSDFRTLDSADITTISSETRLAIRSAQRKRKFYAYLLEVMGSDQALLPKINFDSAADKLAGEFRKRFGVDVNEQKKWKNTGLAFNRWVDLLEGFGIPVLQFSLPKKEIRGFCLKENNLPPTIVLNGGDALSARIFTLFHELYHLLLVQRDIDALVVSRGEKNAHKLIEIKANEFAGSFLVPNEDFLGNEYVREYILTKEDRFIFSLGNLYKVSREVIYRKFVIHGYISEREYEIKREELRRYYEQEELKKKKKIEERDKKFIPDYYRNIVRGSSYALSRKAFHAASEGKISTNELVTFFDVKLSGLKKVLDKTNQHYPGGDKPLLHKP